MTLVLKLDVELPEPWGEEAGDKFGARNIDVGEVGTVGFVEVVICFEEGGVSADLDGRKKGVGEDSSSWGVS